MSSLVYFVWKALRDMFVSTSGFSGFVEVDVIEVTDMGVSPCQAFGVSSPLPYRVIGVMLVPLLPRNLRPSGPGVITSVSLRPAAAIHPWSCDSSALR